MKSKCVIALTLSFTVIFFVTGCAFIPAPRYASGSRRDINQQAADSIRCGLDTTNEVVLKFGKPDQVSRDCVRYTYVAKRIVGELFVVFHDDDGTELPDVVQYRYLEIFFDSNGVVTNRTFSKELIF
jgi:hypothetical protein